MDADQFWKVIENARSQVSIQLTVRWSPPRLPTCYPHIHASRTLLASCVTRTGTGQKRRGSITDCLGGRGRPVPDLSVRRSAGTRRYPQVTVSPLGLAVSSGTQLPDP
jgi:hypothetical protein